MRNSPLTSRYLSPRELQRLYRRDRLSKEPRVGPHTVCLWCDVITSSAAHCSVCGATDRLYPCNADCIQCRVMP